MKETFISFYEKLKRFEEEASPLKNLNIQGISLWNHLKFSLIKKIMFKKGIFDEAPKKTNSSKLKSAKKLLQLKKYDPRKDVQPATNLILQSDRYFEKDKKLKCKYTYNLEKEIDGNSITTTTTANIDTLKSIGLKTYAYLRLLAKVKQKFQSCSITEAEILQINNVKEKFKAIFNEELKFNPTNELKNFITLKRLSKEWLEKLHIQNLYLICSYDKAPLIAAAKELGITVVELQHGVITKYHWGYSYAEEGKPPYFADKLFIWDDEWKDFLQDYPYPESIVTHRFSFLEDQISIYSQIKKPVLTIISQTNIGSSLAGFLLENIQKLEGYEIHYKLHPKEYEIEYNEFKALKENGVKFYKNCDLYELFSQSEYVIGVFSTALFEALKFNCKLVIVPLSSYEYMLPLLKNDKAILFDKAF